MAKTQASFAKFSLHDAEIYPAFDAYLKEATKVVQSLLWETPIDPSKANWKNFREGAGLLWRYRTHRQEDVSPRRSPHDERL